MSKVVVVNVVTSFTSLLDQFLFSFLGTTARVCLPNYSLLLLSKLVFNKV